MGEGSGAERREPGDHVRTGLSVEAFKRAYEDNLRFALGRFPQVATSNDRYLALAYAVRDRLMDRWIRSGEAYYASQARTVCYLSAEFLLGPHLGNNLLNLGGARRGAPAPEDAPGDVPHVPRGVGDDVGACAAVPQGWGVRRRQHRR